MPRAFVIRPFNTKKDSSGQEIDFERVHADLIRPALQQNGLSGETTGEIVESGSIREDMFAMIVEADVVICDVTVHNANVFYELGIRHALRKRTTFMIRGDQTKDTAPFDLLTERYLKYDITAPGASAAALGAAIRDAMASDRPTDSPIFRMVTNLPEADPEKVQVVPPDLQEEIERAGAAKSKGWLRLLSSEIKGRRFERNGLKRVGKAQWRLKDYEGAVLTWERIRNIAPGDIDANLALANVFERMSREPSRPTDERARLLTNSDQAIERVIDNTTATRAQRAEALALKGRNQKTHWREGLAKAADQTERRRAALKRTLMDSYESYLEAFREDLNQFYPGLAAVQMGTILQELSGESGWGSLFKSNRAAGIYREDLELQLPGLTSTVSLAIQAALGRMEDNDPDRRWAMISDSDVLFLTDGDDERVTSAYEHAFAGASPFDWDATRGQLRLFADLGIRGTRAQAVIDKLDPVLGDPPAEQRRPVHLVVFAGHQFDEPGRQPARFPIDHQAAARAVIKARIQQFVDPAHDLVLLGSVSPGADLLWHEACAELGLTTTVCLPMPVPDHARLVFANDDQGRSRFLDIVSPAQKRTVLTLSDQAGPPRWLVSTGTDPWVRGNEWVIQIANSWGAARVTLLAFWDGQEVAAGPSGTAHVVKLARDQGNIYIDRIDSAAVLV